MKLSSKFLIFFIAVFVAAMFISSVPFLCLWAIFKPFYPHKHQSIGDYVIDIFKITDTLKERKNKPVK